MTKTAEKKAIIVGASSGIGLAVARMMLAHGWTLGVAARRREPLDRLAAEYSGHVFVSVIDVTASDASVRLLDLINKMGGTDLYVHVAGVGWQNMPLDAEKESATVLTNGCGFVRMVDAAFNYFCSRGSGHIAAITSIAGTKGLGAAPAYSATKAMQNVYLQALEQHACMLHKKIYITDIRPGFVNTNLLNDGHTYPMLMSVDKVAAAAVKAIEHRRHVAVIDRRYRVLTALWRRLPRFLWRRMRIHT